MTKSYSECVKLKTFEERFRYLKLNGNVGETTFGFNRYLNQSFYSSPEWKRTRNKIILRDEGCDLAIPDLLIYDRIYIHHINPISEEDLEKARFNLFDPENLICVSYSTHNALHFGNESILLSKNFVPRFQNDTCPWRKA